MGELSSHQAASWEEPADWWKGNRQREDRAAARGRWPPDRAAVGLGNPRDDGQPQARAGLLGGEERLEDPRQDILGQARSAVGNVQFQCRGSRRSR